LREVRWFSDNRTPQQLQIAQFWADGAGTYTPPGHWNEIACNLLSQRNWSALRDARALALMNMAVMDAGICCWDAKYAYWLLRPYQADPAITTPVGKPNFPAYTSGHSTFSGAASEVLGYIFPSQLTQLRAMAEEASMSRVYGGIHFRFDSEVGLGAGRSIARDAGLVNGKKIATFSVARALTDGAPPPSD
jgi:membrane-associated phospholipid phosphatase